MLTINELYDLSHSLAGDYLKQFTYPWEALAGISDLILEIGKQLPEDEYVHPTDWDGNVLEDVWVAKDATVFKTAYLHGPCIIGHRTEVRQCAFIRGSALVGNDCVVGNSTEPCWPCGACRQMLYEFAPGLTVLVAQRDHSFVKLPLSELLTHGFGPKSLG